MKNCWKSRDFITSCTSSSLTSTIRSVHDKIRAAGYCTRLYRLLSLSHMKTSLLLISLLAFLTATSQQNNKEFTWYQYEDSITDASTKDPNGRIFKDGELEMQKDGKLYVYMVSEKFSVYLLIKTPSGKWIRKEGITRSDRFYS